MEQNEDPEAVFIPTQTPLINTCSHCAPALNQSPTAFYVYPCQRTHLAHRDCFLHYTTTPLTPCPFCVREGFVSLPRAPPSNITTFYWIVATFLVVFVIVMLSLRIWEKN